MDGGVFSLRVDTCDVTSNHEKLTKRRLLSTGLSRVYVFDLGANLYGNRCSVVQARWTETDGGGGGGRRTKDRRQKTRGQIESNGNDCDTKGAAAAGRSAVDLKRTDPETL